MRPNLPQAKILKFAPHLVGIVLLSCFAVYIWPTPYQYFKSGSSNFRTNRFTGKTQVLDETGWATPYVPPPDPPAPTYTPPPGPSPVNSQALAAISAECSIIAVPAVDGSNGTITVNVHNPTDMTLTGMKVQIWGEDNSGQTFNREYILGANVSSIVPLSDGSFSCSFDNSFALNEITKKVSWVIESVDAEGDANAEAETSYGAPLPPFLPPDVLKAIRKEQK